MRLTYPISPSCGRLFPNSVLFSILHVNMTFRRVHMNVPQLSQEAIIFFLKKAPSEKALTNCDPKSTTNTTKTSTARARSC